MRSICSRSHVDHVSVMVCSRLSWSHVFCCTAPIAYPIAKLLDKVLGANESQTYKKAELKSFLQFHRTGEEPLRDEEISILNGVLELNTKSVESIMTPMKVRPLLAASKFQPMFFCIIGRGQTKRRHDSGSQNTGCNVNKTFNLISHRLTSDHLTAFQVVTLASRFTNPVILWLLLGFYSLKK